MSTPEVRAGLPHTGHARALIEPLENRRLLSGISSPLGLMLESTPLISSEPLVHARAAKSISWTEAAPSPIQRFEAAGEVVGGKLYVFGGFVDADVHATARSDFFNPRKNTWIQIADMPEPLTHTGHVVIGHKIWFVGGFVGD